MPEMARVVLVALVVVPLLTVKAEIVEEADEVTPPRNWVRVEVALPARGKA